MPTKAVKYKGKEYPSVKALATAYDLTAAVVVRRLNSGWTKAQAVGEVAPPKRVAHNASAIKVKGRVFGSLRQAAKHFGLPEATAKRRLKAGWPVIQAFGLEAPPKRFGSPKKIKFLGRVFSSSRERDKFYGLPYNIINKRIKRGWSKKQAAGLEHPPHRHRNIDGSPRKTKLSSYEEIEGTIYPKVGDGEYKLYAITNQINSKQYVGITTSPIEKRLTQHIYTALNSKRPAAIYRAIRKYGKKNFKVELIRNDAKNYKELMQQEYEEIKERNTIKKGYNSSVGGEIGVGKEIQIGGKLFLSHAAAADYYLVEQHKFNWRIRNGWTVEQAVGLEAWSGAGPKPIMVAGKSFRSIQAAARQYSINPQTASNRVRKGWTAEEALGLVKKDGLKNQEITIKLRDRSFSNQASFCREGGFSDALVLIRRKEGWSYQKIWDEYAYGGRERTCVVCGKVFRAMRRDKRNCSRKCSSK